VRALIRARLFRAPRRCADREVQKPLRAFSPGSRTALERLIAAAFPPSTPVLPVHVLDLEAGGRIGKHVDHVEYSGEAIVGLSLLADATMTLHHEPRGYHDVPRGPPTPPADDASSAPEASADAAPWLALRLPRRSMYVLRGAARYEWAHALEPAGRRLALIFRDAHASDAPNGHAVEP
jgi:hypothetical protein